MIHDASTTLDASLRALPHPAPPPDLTGIVLARIAQLEAERRVGATAPPRRMRDRLSWIAAVAGLVAAILLIIGSPAASPPDDFTLVWMRSMVPNLVTVPAATLASVVLAGGLVLFAAGLQVSVAGGLQAAGRRAEARRLRGVEKRP